MPVRIVTTFFYIGAIIILIVALFVAAVRFSNPVLEKRRPDFEKEVSQYLATPVSIRAVHLSWYQYSPAVQFDAVTILNKTTHKPVLHIQKMRVSIAVFKSIWQHKVVMNSILLAGSDININETANKEIHVQGFPALSVPFSSITSYSSETKLTDVMGWLFQQPHLILENIELHDTDYNQAKHWLTIHKLSLDNLLSQHTLNVDADLHQAVPAKITGEVILQSKKADLSDANVEFYWDVSGLELRDWAKYLTYQGWQAKHGLISAKVWTTWNNHAFQSIQTTFEARDLALHQQASSKVAYAINRTTGAIKWDGQNGSLVLNGHDLTIQDDRLFAEAINLTQLISDINFSRRATTVWQIDINELQAITNDFEANIAGKLIAPLHVLPTADLKATLSISKLESLKHYLPVKVMARDLTKWLEQAFISGEVKSMTAQLRGPLADFPFDPVISSNAKTDDKHQTKSNTAVSQSGPNIFSIIGYGKDIELSYAPKWPRLTHLNTKIAFVGRKLSIDSDSAIICGIPAQDIKATIPDLASATPMLYVDAGRINGDINQGLTFLHTSPLEKKLGEIFNNLALTGPMTIKLNLTVPLSNPEQINVKGLLGLQEVRLNLVPWHLLVNHLSGQVQFTEDSITANTLQGQLFNRPLQLSLATLPTNAVSKHANEENIIQAKFNTYLQISDLEKWLPLSFAKVMQGGANLDGSINVGINVPVQIHLHSNLQGVALNLPAPYAKPAQTAGDFAADVSIQKDQPLKIKLQDGSNLSAALLVNGKQDKFSLLAANLQIGNGSADWPKDNGLYITGNFDRLDQRDITKYLDQSNNKTMTPSLPLKGIIVNAKQIEIGALVLHDAHLNVVPDDNNWKIDVAAHGVNGEVIVPKDFAFTKTITAKFTQLSLKTTTAKQENLSFISAKNLPAILFYANNVSYNDMYFGRVSVETEPSPDGLNIKTFDLILPNTRLQANGNWLGAGNSQSTHLQGRIDSTNVSYFLKNMDISARNFVANRGALIFDLSWDDAPYAFSYSNLKGRSSLDLGPGRIVDIGKSNDAKLGIGRLLSIFSLQAIPSHLATGFSDIFQKGYPFNSIKGDFTFKDASLHTSNLNFDGSVASVAIKGRIGLAAKDFDLVLGVTPYVTSSVPVAATFLGGPFIGLAALVVNTFVSKATTLTTYYYKVTGLWSHPVWKSVSSAGQHR